MSFITFIFGLTILHPSLVFALPSFLELMKGLTPEGEIQCYSLQHGGLGFASRLITYYTLIYLWCSTRPLMLWKNWTTYGG
jgi:hypothetical protein